MAGKKHKVQGLRRRWLTGSMGPVLVILLLVGVLISVGFASNYYNSARSTLRAKAAAGADYFNTYVMTSYREYYRSATIYAAAFDDSDKIELQFLNSSGRVEVTTRGVTTGTYPSTPEILRALESGTVQDYIGRDSVTGERILAVSGLLKFNGRVVGVMRFVTATRNLDSQVLLTVLIILAIMAAVIFVIVISSLLLINNVVAPVSAVSEAAKQISGGSYGYQIPNRYADEMGELVDNINDMSLKIKQSEKTQSEFISSVSHELRTPLTAITGWAETIAYDPAVQVDSLRGIHIISKEAERLTGMVKELLEFTRIQDGRFNLRVELIDIAAELEDALFTYGELMRQAGIEVNYTEPPVEIPLIPGDPERLKQVFLNILDNAAKYARDGKTIEVSVFSDSEAATIQFRDHGPGIPENELPHVKEKFFKGEKHKARGSGIGLAVCDEIITRSGGTLTIANAPGGGTLVSVRLPFAPESSN